MSGQQRGERSRVTQQEGRRRRRPQLLHIWPPATAFPPPVRPCRVQEKLTTLNILRLSLSRHALALALLPPKLLPTTQDYSLAQRGEGRPTGAAAPERVRAR